MDGKRTEVIEVLQTSERIVADAEIAAEFRVAAFEAVVSALFGTLTDAPQVQRQRHPGSESSVDRPRELPLLRRIAQTHHLDESALSDIYRENDGDLELIVHPMKLDKAKKGGTRQIAQLVAFGRQASGLEVWTPLDTIREVAESYKRYDQPNFARTIGEMQDSFSQTGSSRERQVKLSRPGYVEVVNLIRGLLGGAE